VIDHLKRHTLYKQEVPKNKKIESNTHALSFTLSKKKKIGALRGSHITLGLVVMR
jgi:hypothetical protein